MEFSAQQIAGLVGGTIEGNPEVKISLAGQDKKEYVPVTLKSDGSFSVSLRAARADLEISVAANVLFSFQTSIAVMAIIKAD